MNLHRKKVVVRNMLVFLEGLNFNIFGVPAHPLVVHGVVVLLPLSSIAFVALCWRPQWREMYLFPIALLSLGAALSAFLAKVTGEALSETVKEAGKRVGDHPEQGDTAFVLAVVFAGLVLLTFVLDRFGPYLRDRLGVSSSLRLPVTDVVAAYLLTLPFAIAAVVAVVIAGHSGAALVWKTL
jgi:hypothetical protein